MILLLANVLETETGDRQFTTSLDLMNPTLECEQQTCHLECGLLSSSFSVYWFRLSMLAVIIILRHNVLKFTW